MSWRAVAEAGVICGIVAFVTANVIVGVTVGLIWAGLDKMERYYEKNLPRP